MEYAKMLDKSSMYGRIWSGGVDLREKCGAPREFIASALNDPRKLLCVVYVIAHIPLLGLARARYWDDWSLHESSPDVLLDTFRQAGSLHFGYFHLFILKYLGGFYSVLSFIVFLVISLFVFEISKRIFGAQRVALYIAAIFAISPLNYARVAGINLPSAVCLMLFVMAWYMLLSGPKFLSRRIAIPLIFLFSFQVGSLLVLYLAPVAFHIWQGRERFVRRTIESADLLILPIIFWTVRGLWLQPYGMFSGYNQPSFRAGQILSTFTPMLDYLLGTGITVSFSAVMIIFIFSAYMGRRSWGFKSYGVAPVPLAMSAGIAVFGLFLTFLGLFPYIAVGKVPSFVGWTETRHQVAAMFGFAVMTAGIILAISEVVSERVRRSLNVFLVILGVVNWWAVYAEFYIDHARQISLAKIMETNSSLREGNFIIVDVTGMGAFGASSGWGELTGIHSMAGNPPRSLIVDYLTVGDYGGWKKYYETYNRFLGGWNKTEDANPATPPSLYVLSRRSARESRLQIARWVVLADVFHWNKAKVKLEKLLKIDGPFVPTSLPSGS
jgi:hypothetical protein